MEGDTFTGGDISAAFSAAGGDSPAPAATLTETPPVDSASVPATAAPTETTPAGSTSTPQGPIPYERHKEILENARKEYAWVQERGLTRERAEAMQRWYDQAGQDPVAFAVGLVNELNAHPLLGPQIRSAAGKTLASARGQNQMPAPDVQVTDPQGNVVSTTYSAGQLAKRDAWLTEQIINQVRSELGPVAQQAKLLTDEREAAQITAQSESWSKGFMGELASYPHFEANKKAIGERVVQILNQYPDDPRTDDPHFLEAVTLRAYQQVVGAAQDKNARQAVLGDLKHKAAASTANPTTSSTSAPKAVKDMSWKEAMEYEWSKRSAAGVK